MEWKISRNMQSFFRLKGVIRCRKPSRHLLNMESFGTGVTSSNLSVSNWGVNIKRGHKIKPGIAWGVCITGCKGQLLFYLLNLVASKRRTSVFVFIGHRSQFREALFYNSTNDSYLLVTAFFSLFYSRSLLVGNYDHIKIEYNLQRRNEKTGIKDSYTAVRLRPKSQLEVRK